MHDINEIFASTSSAGHGQEDQWISLSDLMTGLMMIFMLIAVAFMLKTEADSMQLKTYAAQAAADAEKMQAVAQHMQDEAQKRQEDAAKTEEAAQKIKQIAVVYDQVKTELYDALMKEFSPDLPVWGATINKDLSIRFDNEDVMFDRGQDQVKPGFGTILQNFFPRYLRIITAEKFRSSIQEVRIEGHTSSIWGGNITPQEAYFKNMELSQSRTRSTLRFVMELPQVQGATGWLQRYVTANGLSSSHPVVNPNGTENEVKSQRVEFRIRTDAESKINDILQSETKAAQ